MRPAHTHTTPRHVLRCRRTIREGCWTAVVVLHRSLAFRSYEVWLERQRGRLQGPGGLALIPHRRDTAAPGALPRSRAPRVLELLLLALLRPWHFEGAMLGLYEDAEIRGSRCQSDVPDSPEPSFRRRPSAISAMRTVCSWARAVMVRFSASLRLTSRLGHGWRVN